LHVSGGRGLLVQNPELSELCRKALLNLKIFPGSVDRRPVHSSGDEIFIAYWLLLTG
jgi:hypothetical protein